MPQRKFLAGLLLAVLSFSVNQSNADVIDDFDTGSTGTGTLNGGNGGWNAKWDGGDATQRNLYSNTAGIGTAGSNAVSLDVLTAKRSYNAVNQTGVSVAAGAGNTMTLSADFQVSIDALTGGVLTHQNKAFIGLQLKDDDQWWSGSGQGVTSYDFTLNRRGGTGQVFGVNSPGNAINGWHNVTNWGLTNGLVAGTTDWFKMEVVLTDNGTTYDAVYNLYNGSGGIQHTESFATAYTSGTTLYGGFTTGYSAIDNMGTAADNINAMNDVSGISVDNFSFVTAVPEPTSASLITLGLFGLALSRRRNS